MFWGEEEYFQKQLLDIDISFSLLKKITHQYKST